MAGQSNKKAELDDLALKYSQRQTAALVEAMRIKARTAVMTKIIVVVCFIVAISFFYCKQQTSFNTASTTPMLVVLGRLFTWPSIWAAAKYIVVGVVVLLLVLFLKKHNEQLD